VTPPLAAVDAPAVPAGARRHAGLVGLMGAGKTAVGERLAHDLGLPFVDGDAALTVLTGRDAATIAAADGVPALAALEARVLLDALATPGPSVIAAAASVVDDPVCRRALRGAGVAVVRLRARPRTLAARHGAGAHRRPLGPDLVAAFAAQSRARASRIAAVRPLATIDVDDAPVGDVAAEALRALRGAGIGDPDV
jgi:shikimate kinase